MSNINIQAVKAFMVPDAEGRIDYQASGKKFLDALKGFETLVETDHKAIAGAFTKVFDQYKGVNITNVTNFIMRELNPTPDTYAHLKESATDYLKGNTGEVGEAIYGMRKGAGGGHFRWDDKVETDDLVKKSRERIAERNTEAAKS